MRRRHRHAHRSGRRSEALLVLLIEEEKEFLFVRIEEFRYPDRPANGIPDVALIEPRFIVDPLTVRANGLVTVVDPGVCVHPVMATEGVKRTVKIARPAPRHRTDLRPSRAPILGLVV